MTRKSDGESTGAVYCSYVKKDLGLEGAEMNNVANISLGLCSNSVNYGEVNRWHLVYGLQPSDLLLKGDRVV